MDKYTFKRLLLVLFLITGLFFLFMGYSEYFADIKKSKNYKTTDGYFMKYEMDSSKNPVIYTLTYSYVVNKQTYFVNASNKVTKLPPLGSQKKIKYQEENPQISLVVELGGGIKYIVCGIIFLIVALFSLVNRLLNKDKENEHNFYKIAGMISGIIVVLIGGFIYYLYGVAVDSSGIVDIWNAINFMSVIPFILLLAGFIIIITTIFFNKEDEM